MLSVAQFQMGLPVQLYPSIYDRDKVNNNKKFQIFQKCFQNVQLFHIIAICKCGYLDILQNSLVKKFVWGEINSGYTVVTKAKNWTLDIIWWLKNLKTSYDIFELIVFCSYYVDYPTVISNIIMFWVREFLIFSTV